jgi:transcriptional/translational regulatory protein YebC/TACO1
MAGHSKWFRVRHTKGASEVKHGKFFNGLSKAARLDRDA